MKITIATVERVAAFMFIANQRAMGFTKIDPFSKLGAVGRAMYRAEAEAALRALAPMIERAEKRAFKRGWAECESSHKHD